MRHVSSSGLSRSSATRNVASVTALALLLASSEAPAQSRAPAAAGCRHATERQAYALQAFFGYACREPECAGHKAGFAWADRGGITDPLACTGSEDLAFEEGCRAFAEDAVTAEQAGFEWARENEVVDACQCRGAGPRFEAGCEAYVAGFAR